MVRRTLRTGFLAALAALVAVAVWRVAQRLRPFDPAPLPEPLRPPAWPRITDAEQASATPPAWVDPVESACPLSHPVKAKLGSGIFHVEGNSAYERTRPDRCYLDEASALADGLRPARR